ncbi:MAG: patatin-like phospholipase family protein [Planctomycetota bacterium]|jgi:hypothetical protein
MANNPNASIPSPSAPIWQNWSGNLVLNSRLTPNLSIWRAVRASMSIPLIFEPVKIDGDLYVDGALGWIFPINIYDTTRVDKASGDEYYERNPATL